MNDDDSSFGQKELDQKIDEYEFNSNGVKINIEEFKVNDSEEKRYIAEFEYRDTYYQLKGVMDKAVLEKILKNLLFF